MILCVAAAIAVIIVLIAAVKLPPFISILCGAVVGGSAAGLPLSQLVKAFSDGAGDLLGGAGLVIALGAMLGAILSKSGAADRVASTLLDYGKGRLLPWMMALVAMVIGLPLFFEVGLVIMIPLIFVMARRSGSPILYIAIPALAGLTTLHALVPPHPGPLIAIRALHAELGLTLLLGLVIAIPAVILAGPLYAIWLAPRLNVGTPSTLQKLFANDTDDTQGPKRQPAFSLSLAIVLLPAVLMLGRTLATLLFDPAGMPATVLNALGEPLVALAITVLAAAVLLGWGSGMSLRKTGDTLTNSLAPIAALLLTIGAGGGLKQVLLAIGISDTVSTLAHVAHLSDILLAWLIAVALRQATGSATVATTTTAGIVAPLVVGAEPIQASLIALSIGAGSVFFCHVNDAGFWMVREYFSLTLRQTLATWSVLQTIVSVVGLAMTLLLSALLL